MKYDQDIVTIREFARRLAVTMSGVKTMIKRGVIKKHKSSPPGHYLLDFTTEAPKFISNSSDPSRYTPEMIKRRQQLNPKLKHEGIRDKTKPTSRTKLPPPGLDALSDDREGSDGEYSLPFQRTRAARRRHKLKRMEEMQDIMIDGMTASAAKTSREVWRAKREKFNYELSRGKYMLTKKVKADWEDMSTLVRTGLLSIPDRVDAQISGLIRCHCGDVKVDRDKINELLRVEIRNVLTNLSYDIEKKALAYAKREKKSDETQEDEESEE